MQCLISLLPVITLSKATFLLLCFCGSKPSQTSLSCVQFLDATKSEIKVDAVGIC